MYSVLTNASLLREVRILVERSLHAFNASSGPRLRSRPRPVQTQAVMKCAPCIGLKRKNPKDGVSMYMGTLMCEDHLATKF